MITFFNKKMFFWQKSLHGILLHQSRQTLSPGLRVELSYPVRFCTPLISVTQSFAGFFYPPPPAFGQISSPGGSQIRHPTFGRKFLTRWNFTTHLLILHPWLSRNVFLKLIRHYNFALFCCTNALHVTSLDENLQVCFLGILLNSWDLQKNKVEFCI